MKVSLKIAVFLSLAFLMAIGSFAQTEHDGYILKFKDDESKAFVMELLESDTSLFCEEDSFEVETIVDAHNLYKTDSEALAIELYELGLLEYYEPDAICYLMDYDYSLDRYFSTQMSWAHACSKAPDAWQYGVCGNDVKVAVIDSGVLLNHEELSSCILPGYSFVDSDEDGELTQEDCNDNLGHGTGVSGVIAAQANGKGVVGVAHRAKIVPIKVTDSGPFGSSVIYQAINKAIELDVDVINLSLGTKGNPQSLKTAVDNAISAGIIVIAASGNTSSYTQGTAVYPGYYDNVISVGNIMKSGSDFVISSGSIANSQVTISAPGTSIITPYKSGGYVYYTGTSFACPYVAGIAALAKSIDPDITQAEFMQILLDTADKSKLNGAVRLDTYGYGIADAGAVVEELIRQRNKGGFISPIDRTTSGSINVKIYNPTGQNSIYTFITKVQGNSNPSAFSIMTVPLEAGAMTEIPLTTLRGSATSEISCYLLDPIKWKPVYTKVYN